MQYSGFYTKSYHCMFQHLLASLPCFQPIVGINKFKHGLLQGFFGKCGCRTSKFLGNERIQFQRLRQGLAANPLGLQGPRLP